jgi:uncharacterized protein
MYKTARIVLLVIAFITAIILYKLPGIGFDYDFEKFFPQQDEDTEFFLDYRKQFGSDNDFVLVGITNQGGIFDHDFLKEVHRLTLDLSEINHVERASSLTNLTEPVRDPLIGQVFEKQLLRFDQPEWYARDSARIYSNPDLIDSYVSRDGKSLSIILNTTEYLSKAKCDTLAEQLFEVTANYSFDKLHLAGRSTGQSYYVSLMQYELVIFIIASAFLVILFLTIAFRSFWGVWVPLIVVMLGIIWTLGLMYFTNKPIDLMLTVLPTILFVVGMSDVVHLLSKYMDELRAGREKNKAIFIAFKEVGIATFLTSLTTSIGFLTLLTSTIIPVKGFGIYTAAGVFIAYLLAFTFLPAMLLLTKGPKPPKDGRNFWAEYLNKLFVIVIRNPKTILIGSLVFILICLVGISKVRVNNFLLEDLKESSSLKQDFLYFEENFSGVRPFELAVFVTDTTHDAFSPETLSSLEKLHEYLEKQYGSGALVSPLTIVKNLNKMNQGKYQLPKEKELDKMRKELKQAKGNELLTAIVSSDWHTFRVFGKMPDFGSAVVKEKERDFWQFIFENNLNQHLDFRLTGSAVLIDKNNSFLAVSMMYGLVIAFGVIGLIVGIMFKSLRMVIISLVPNVLPLLLIGAVMGYFGISLKVSTSIIFTIAFGIAVDDTIHFLSKYRLELAKGKSQLIALRRTFVSTGKAIIVTTLILSGGFLTLILSDFLGTFYVGLLVGLALLFAVIADLVLLPVLLLLFQKRG